MGHISKEKIGGEGSGEVSVLSKGGGGKREGEEFEQKLKFEEQAASILSADKDSLISQNLPVWWLSSRSKIFLTFRMAASLQRRRMSDPE